MGAVCKLLTPRFEKVSITVEDDDSIFTLVVDIDAVLRIDDDAMSVSELDAFW